MKQRYAPIFLFLFLFIVAGCSGSKGLTKKGHKLNEAGLYQEAARYYYDALLRKSTNVDAQIALKETGQKVLNDQLADFYQAYGADEHKKAVYTYREALQYQKRVDRVGVTLDIPDYYESYYDESKNKYLAVRYQEAQSALDEERFTEAQSILKEMAKLDPDYEEVKELKQYATVEPLYRKGVEALENDRNRTAYNYFKQILDEGVSYKDSEELMGIARENALFTIGMLPFENNSRVRGVSDAISAKILSSIVKKNDPFIKIIDREHTQTILDEQMLGLTGAVDEQSAANAGELLGAKAILAGKVISASSTEGRLQRSVKKGYVSRSVKKQNKETKEYYTVTEYDKVNYYEYRKRNAISCSFQYRLISSETGEVLISDLIELTEEDETHYATYDGKARNLYSGIWKYQSKNSGEDKINKSYSQRRQLQSLLKANRDVRSVESLSNDLYKKIGKRVARKITNFNPEKE